MINLSAFKFERIEVSNKPKGLSVTAERVFITVEGECRYRYDDQADPTYTEGHLLRDGSYLVLNGEVQIKSFRAISTTNDSCVLQISFER